GALKVTGGTGDDTVSVGVTAPVTVHGDAHINLGAGTGDMFELGADSEVTGNMQTSAAESVLLDAGSHVDGNLVVTNVNTLDLSGSVDGNATITGAVGAGRDTGANATISGDIGGNLVFVGTNQADTLDMTGNVLGNATVQLGAGNDTASIDGVVTGNLLLNA